MNSPTRSEKFSLLLLSVALLLGMGVSYYRKNNLPFSLKVVSVSQTHKYEENFEASKHISLKNGKEEDFARLPHVGPQLAKRIVAYREKHGFYRKEELIKVKGIGAKTYEALKDLLVVE